MTAGKAIRLPPLLVVLPGSSLCASGARAAGAADAVRQGGAGPGQQFGSSRREVPTANPRS